MVDTIRTADQLVDRAPDNTLRLVTPQKYRDFIVSAFGATLPFDPTPQDDAYNTAGNGYFAAGSRWTNTLAPKKVWQCFSGAHNAADWRLIYPTDPGTIVEGVSPIVSTLTSPGVYTVSYAGPPPFNPATASSCFTWLESDGTLWADVGKTIPASNGSSVEWWIDAALTHHDYSRLSTIPVPTLVTGLYNGKPGVEFNGTQQLRCGSVTELNSAAAATFVTVVNFKATGNTNNSALGLNNVGNLLHMQSGGPLWMVGLGGGHNCYATIPASLGAAHVVSIVFDGSGATDADKLRLFFDGVQQSLTFLASMPSTLPAGSSLDIGALSGGFFSNIDMCALGAFSAVLSDVERQAIEAYLSNKYLGTSIPTTQYVGVGHGLSSVGPPWAPTLSLTTPIAGADLPAILTSYLSYDVAIPAAHVGSGYPAADLAAGTLSAGVLIPASQVGSGYPAADLAAGTLSAGVLIPASQVGSGYLYSDLTGAPAAPSAATIAATGTTQGTAAALTAENNIVTSGSAGNDSVILPATVGARIIVANRTGSVNVRVFPPVGESIVGLPPNSNVQVTLSVESLFMRFTNALGYFYWGRIG